MSAPTHRLARSAPQLALPGRPAAALLLALLLGSCSSKVQKVVGCQQDSECGDPAHFSCEVSTGVCHCRDDAACQKGEFCNPAGFCQAKVTCYTNADCDPSQICDDHANVCIASGRCTSDDQCALGTLCDRATGTCQAGCHSYGDCPSSQACLCATSDGGRAECSCDSLDPAVRAQCPIGSCSSDACPFTGACAYGLTCEAPDAGGLSQCVNTYDHDTRPYCDACVAQPGAATTCGTAALPNFCLVDTSKNGFGTNYCGVDCSQGQSCPNGYHCEDVVTFRSIGCTVDTDCPVNSTPCTQDADCPNAGLCQKTAGASSGLCSGRCFKREGATAGFCTCTLDSECNQDVCDTTTRTCSITRQPCDPNQAQPCATIRCVVSFSGAGGCVIGQNCKPIEGLTCAQIRPP